VTIIVGVIKDGDVAIAADSCNSFGTLRVPRENNLGRKLHPVGDAWIASAGWGAYSNLLDEYLPLQPKPALGSVSEVYRFFLEFWRSLKRDYQYVNDQGHTTESPWAQFDASFLVAGPSGLFLVSSNISVTPFRQYWAIGSGQEYALGAALACYDSDRDAGDVARTAVDAGIAFDDGCQGPIDVQTVSLTDGA